LTLENKKFNGDFHKSVMPLKRWYWYYFTWNNWLFTQILDSMHVCYYYNILEIAPVLIIIYFSISISLKTLLLPLLSTNMWHFDVFLIYVNRINISRARCKTIITTSFSIKSDNSCAPIPQYVLCTIIYNCVNNL